MSDQHPELPVVPGTAGEHPPRSAARRPAHARPWLLLAVAAGGLLGTPVRYELSLWLPAGAHGWPWATFTVNVVGAFVLGVLLEGLARAGADAGWRRGVRLFAGTGFCGALTTYSTLAVEIDLLLGHHTWAVAVGYGLASVAAGVAAAAAGIAVAVRYHRGRPRPAPRAADSQRAGAA